MSDKHRIEVNARSAFIPEQSDTEKGRYVFAYTITITNKGGRDAPPLLRIMTRRLLVAAAAVGRADRLEELRRAGRAGLDHGSCQKEGCERDHECEYLDHRIVPFRAAGAPHHEE